MDTLDEWIVSRTGIRERRRTHKDETSSDLAYTAARRALRDAGLQKEQVDLILVATATPDMLFPSTACLVQEKLGIHTIPAFDLSAVCTGFIYGLATADAFIRSGAYRTILLIGVDTLTKFVNPIDHVNVTTTKNLLEIVKKERHVQRLWKAMGVDGRKPFFDRFSLYHLEHYEKAAHPR